MAVITPQLTDLDPGEFIALRKFGTVDVAVVRSGFMFWRPDFPDDQEWHTDVLLASDGAAVMDITGLLVRTPQACVVVDPNVFDEADGVPASAPAPLELGLAAMGMEADQVTHVLLTHGHRDHFSGVLMPGGELRFPNAAHFFPRADVPAPNVHGPHQDAVREVTAAVDASGQLHLTDGDTIVVDGITLLSTPGETAGHQAVRIDHDAGRIYYLGDLVHFPSEVDHISWVGHPCDVAVLAASRRRLYLDAQESAGSIIFAHGRFPGWGTVHRVGADQWRWVYD